MTNVIKIVIILFILSSCCKKDSLSLPHTTVMENLLIEKPDSLAYILEYKITPSLLSDSDKIEYSWWLTNVHKKQNRSLINDSMIHKVLLQDKQTQVPRLFTTYLLAADQAKWKGDLALNNNLLNEALQLAVSKNDSRNILTFSLLLGKMIQKGDDPTPLLTIINKYNSQLDALEYNSFLTNLYRKTEIPDSLAKYSLKAIELAIINHDTNAEYMNIRHYVHYLNKINQPEKALETLKNFTTKYKEKNVYSNEIKFDYISTYIELGKYDSAREMIKSFDQLFKQYQNTKYEKELYLIEAILENFSNIIDAKENKGGVYINTVFDKIMKDMRNNQKNETEILEAQHRLQLDKVNLELEKNQLQENLLWASLILILIISIIIFIYQQQLLKKEKSLKKIREQLLSKSEEINKNQYKILENEEVINDLNSQLNDNEEIKNEIDCLLSENENIKEINKSLLCEIQVYSETVDIKDKELDYLQNLSTNYTSLMEQNKYLTMLLIRKTKILNDLKTNPRYIEPSKWIDIFHAIDEIFENYSVRLHMDYSNLTDEDIKYCCLFKLQLSNVTISEIMGISPSSVTKRKQRIKEKMNLRK